MTIAREFVLASAVVRVGFNSSGERDRHGLRDRRGAALGPRVGPADR